MNILQLIQRAELLIQQDRHAQAEDVLRQVLSEEPDFGIAHSLLAICIMRDRDKLAEATLEAEQGIHLDPDSGFAFYVHAIVMNARNRFEDAMGSVVRAIELDPSEARYHGTQAQLFAKKEKWEPCLETAQTGLQFDAEDEVCQLMNTLALERLGRIDDSLAEADRAIANDPDDSYAHSAKGWALYASGDYKEAQVSFREALRLDPNNEMARSGMVRALNSRHFIFRVMTQFLLWVSRLNPSVQYGLVIGLWVGINVLQAYGRNNEWIRPFVLPISLSYLLFVILSWIAHPLFNTLLRFNAFGKYLLSRSEIWMSNFIGGVFVLAIGFCLLDIVVRGPTVGAFNTLIFGIYLVVPTMIMFATEEGWPRQVSIGLFVLFLVGYLAIGLLSVFGNTSILSQENYETLINAYMIGIIIYCFGGNKLTQIHPQR